MSSPRPRLSRWPAVRRARSHAVWLTPLLALLLGAVVVACDDDAPEAGGASGGGATAQGLVVDVRGSITQVDQFDLLLSDGTRFTVVPEAGVLERSGFSPAHLREHMALAEPIAITYREDDGRNIMTGVADATE